MFGDMIGLSKPCGRNFRCEEPILLHFCLQIVNDKVLKTNNEICLKFEYQLKQKTIQADFHSRILSNQSDFCDSFFSLGMHID